MAIVLFIVALGFCVASGKAAEAYTKSHAVGASVGCGLLSILLGMQAAAMLIATAPK